MIASSINQGIGVNWIVTREVPKDQADDNKGDPILDP